MRLSVLTLLAVIPSAHLFATAIWQNTGPEGGVVHCIAPSPSDSRVVYAGLEDGGVYRSEDGGENWNAASEGLGDFDVLSLAVSPADARRVLAGTQSGGAYLSSDGGVSWTAIPSLSGSIGAVLFDPAAPQTAYAAGIGGTVAKSGDGGATWIPIAASAAGQQPRALAIDPTHTTTVYLGTLLDGVYRSDDGGASWTPRKSGLDNLHVQALVVDPTAPATVYAGTVNGSVYRTTDGGGSWSFFGSGLSGADVAALAADSTGGIFLGNRRGAYMLELGLAWSRLNLSENYVNAMAVGPGAPGRLFIGSGQLPFATGRLIWTDDLANFSPASGIHGISIISLAVDPFARNRVIAAGTGVSFLSEDAGGSWRALAIGSSLPVSVAFDPDEAGVVYEGGAGGVQKSLDGGLTWANANSGLPAVVVRPVLPVPGTTGIVVAGTAAGAYRSADGGASWQAATGLTAVVWTLFADSSGTLWAGADDGVYRSSDGGAAWSKTGNLTGPVRAVLVSSSGRILAGTDAGLFGSVDSGATWTPSSGGFPAGVGVFALLEDPPRGAVFVGAFPGLYESLDGGLTWSAAEEGLTNPFVYALALPGGGSLLAGTRAGSVFRLLEPAARGDVTPIAPRGTPRALPPRP